MPCRCDYEPAPVGRTLTEEHTRACQAQSLVHKLALLLEQNNLAIPKELVKRIEATRRELIAHKRKEPVDEIFLLLNTAVMNEHVKFFDSAEEAEEFAEKIRSMA